MNPPSRWVWKYSAPKRMTRSTWNHGIAATMAGTARAAPDRATSATAESRPSAALRMASTGGTAAMSGQKLR